MSEFCEHCPMRGNVVGPIVGHTAMELVYFNRRVEVDFTASVMYGSGLTMLSEPYRVPNDELRRDAVQEDIYDRIEACEGPLTRTRGVIRKRIEAVGCPALEDRQFDSMLRQFVKSMAERQLS